MNTRKQSESPPQRAAETNKTWKQQKPTENNGSQIRTQPEANQNPIGTRQQTTEPKRNPIRTQLEPNENPIGTQSENPGENNRLHRHIFSGKHPGPCQEASTLRGLWLPGIHRQRVHQCTKGWLTGPELITWPCDPLWWSAFNQSKVA